MEKLKIYTLYREFIVYVQLNILKRKQKIKKKRKEKKTFAPFTPLLDFRYYGRNKFSRCYRCTTKLSKYFRKTFKNFISENISLV